MVEQLPSPKVLIADDIASCRCILRDMLEEMGFNDIIEARDGKEAFDLLEQQSVSLVLTDYMMYPENGIDLVKGLRAGELNKSVPIYLLTAVAEQEVVDEAMSLGATGYINKPIRFDTLRKIVIDTLRGQMR